MPTIAVKGMRCEHCRKAVTEAISKIGGVSEAQVDLQQGLVSWKDADPDLPATDAVKKTVKDIGFDVS